MNKDEAEDSLVFMRRSVRDQYAREGIITPAKNRAISNLSFS